MLNIVMVNIINVSSDCRPNLCKRRRAAAGELCIPQESWPFSPSFFTLFPCIDIFFITSIDLVGTHERIAKIRVPKSQILKFLWDSENSQNWI